LNADELENGKFKEDVVYNIKFTAVDAAGNQMDKTLYFKCVYDCTAPVITLGSKVVDGRITLKTGLTEAQVKSAIAASVIDGKDKNVTLEYEFQHGAFDDNGKLNEGWFTLTITASDDSGNESVEIISVIGDPNASAGSTGGSDGGCGSNIGGSLVLGSVALLAAGFVIVSKKRSAKNK
jgi:hypothetical protein